MPKDGRKVAWSKSDTKLLFQLCNQFDLRFIPITDRFNFEKQSELRKIEDKKMSKFQQTKGSKRARKCNEKDAKRLEDAKQKQQQLQQKADAHALSSEKTVEEIKDRYFSVCKAVL